MGEGVAKKGTDHVPLRGRLVGDVFRGVGGAEAVVEIHTADGLRPHHELFRDGRALTQHEGKGALGSGGDEVVLNHHGLEARGPHGNAIGAARAQAAAEEGAFVPDPGAFHRGGGHVLDNNFGGIKGLTSIAGHGATNHAGGEVCGLGNAAAKAQGGRQE